MDKMLRTLLILDIVRGEHSTGVLLVGSNGSTEIHKKVGNPYNLFDSRQYSNSLNYVNNVMMGHNRWASVGKINTMNAHPFEHGNIIGSHNGTVYTQSSLDDHKDFEVDSDNIFYHLNIHGVNDTCKLLGGAYALTWYDSSDTTINFVRNDERPLYYAFTVANKNLVWASERWMLEVAATKVGVKLGEIVSLPTAKHYSLTVPLGGCNGYPMLGEFDITDVEEFSPPKKKLPVVTKAGSGTTTCTTTTGVHSAMTSKDTWKLLGKEVEFIVIGANVALKNVIDLQLVGMSGIQARVLSLHTTEMYKMLTSSDYAGVLFSGKVKRVNKKIHWSIMIDKNSIKEVVYEDDAEWDEGDYAALEGKYPVGYPVRMKSLSEWEMATSCGCAWCGDVPQAGYEAKSLVWFSDTEHVCAGCAEDQYIKEYLHL